VNVIGSPSSAAGGGDGIDESGHALVPGGDMCPWGVIDGVGDLVTGGVLIVVDVVWSGGVSPEVLLGVDEVSSVPGSVHTQVDIVPDHIRSNDVISGVHAHVGIEYDPLIIQLDTVPLDLVGLGTPQEQTPDRIFGNNVIVDEIAVGVEELDPVLVLGQIVPADLVPVGAFQSYSVPILRA